MPNIQLTGSTNPDAIIRDWPDGIGIPAGYEIIPEAVTAAASAAVASVVDDGLRPWREYRVPYTPFRNRPAPVEREVFLNENAFFDEGNDDRDDEGPDLDEFEPPEPPANPTRRSLLTAYENAFGPSAKSKEKNFTHFEDTIGDIFQKTGFQNTKEDSRVALELENESLIPLDMPKQSGWAVHSEGSLRNFGFEYVQTKPLQLKNTLSSLKSLLGTLNKTTGTLGLTDSIRTSTHVHFDVTKYNFLDIVNFSSLYWMLEGFLSHYCGDSRKGNLFCLRLKDANVGQIFMKEAVTSFNPWSIPLIRNDYRYSSLNLSSIQKFGSLEFRMMRGSSVYEDIEKWVLALEAIKQYALQFKNPLLLRDHFIKDIEARQLPEVVLGRDLYKDFAKARKSSVPLEEEIREGFLNVSCILSAHQTYDFTEDIKKERETKKNKKVFNVDDILIPTLSAGGGGVGILTPAPRPSRASQIYSTGAPYLGTDELHDLVDSIDVVVIYDYADE